MISSDPVYEGDYILAMQTNLTDNTAIGRVFDPAEGVDIEVSVRMESYPMYEPAFGCCVAVGTPTGENLGMFTDGEGQCAFVEVTTNQGLNIEVVDTTFTMMLNEWYRYKIQYVNGRFYVLLMDDSWNVLAVDVIYVRDFLVNQVILIAWGLNGGWNYFDAFSIDPWNGFEGEHYLPVDPTSKPYAIIITDAVLNDSTLEVGDEIGVFTSSHCVGTARVDGNWPLEMLAWGETGGRPGFTDGDQMQFRIWDRQNDTEYFADISFDVGDGTLGETIFSRVHLAAAGEVRIEETHTNVPSSFNLSPAYPNPFNAGTVMDMTLPEASHVTIGVYNLLGQRVAILTDKQYEAGYHQLAFDAKGLSSGVYFIRASLADIKHIVRKVVLMK